MLDFQSKGGLALLLLLACDAAQTDNGARDAPEAGVSAEQPSEFGSNCNTLDGYVSEPARYATPRDDGTLGRLKVLASRVEATTVGGDTFDCKTVWPLFPMSFQCNAEADLHTVTLHVGEQQWTQAVDAPRSCAPLEFLLDDLAPCVPDDAVVLEGRILNYTPDHGPAPRVWLQESSTLLVMRRLEEQAQPRRQCTVEGDRYQCRSLGYREDMPHEVVISSDASMHTTELTLSVKACQPTLATLDLDFCYARVSALEVILPGAANLPKTGWLVVARYESGDAYRCVARTAPLSDAPPLFVCPAGATSTLGEGRYEITATREGTRYADSVTRIKHNCEVIPARIELSAVNPVAPETTP